MGRSDMSSKSQDLMVYLNVYDLSEQNNFLYWCGFGVFHTGVEVFGFEYAYGGHDFEASGIFATEPKKPPGPVEFRRSIPMGTCKLTRQEVRRLVVQLGKEYKGNSYHLLQKNCNHFANELCQKLVGKSAPTWVNRLAGLAVLCHCLLPASWVPPLNTPSLPEEDAPRTERRTLLHAPRSDVYQESDPTSEESFEFVTPKNTSTDSDSHMVVNG